MSFRIATSAALSGLLATEARTSVASANIANADVEGYTAKTVSTATTVASGATTGVTISNVDSYVDENLVKSIMDAATDAAYAEQIASYLDTLSSAIGSTDDDSDLSSRLTELQTALEALAVTPESDSEKYLVVEAAVAVVQELNDLSDEVQSLRAQADAQIEDSVAELNTALETIDSLNEQISAYKAQGIDTSTLEDQRRVALETVAEKLDISYFETSSGEMHVYTSSGTPLVDSKAHTVDYTAAGTVSSGMTAGDFNSITVDGKTLNLSGGEIGALLELRDETLPAVQEELDALAATLMSELNAIHNQGTSLPAPESLTGSAIVTPTDTVSATGTMRIALVDTDGAVDTVADIDLSTCTTYQDVADAIDAVTGVTASFDAEGRLVVSSDDSSLGVAINEMDSALGTDGVGVSTFFGLNDLFSGTSAADISVRSDIADDYNLLSVATLSSDTTLASGDSGLASGDGSIVEALESGLGSSQDFSQAGTQSATSTTVAEYASDILSGVATQSSVATAKAETETSVLEGLEMSFSNESGVNLDEETALLAELEDLYSACSQVFEVLSQMFDSLLEAVS